MKPYLAILARGQCRDFGHIETLISVRPWRRLFRRTRVLVCWRCPDVWIEEP